MTLTQLDINEIENIVGEKIEERTKNLPTKNEFFNWMDKIMGELKTVREEITILSGMKSQVNNLETRVEKVEKKLSLPL